MSDHTYRYPEAIVSTEWLQANLDDSALRVFDCTTYLIYETGTGQPYSVKSGRADYDSGHVPGAGFLDLQGELSNTDSPYRFTMLPAATLTERLGARGIGDDNRVVLYSRDRMQWATRIWWMLRSIGFDNASVLNGGFDKWKAEGREISTEPLEYPSDALTPRPRAGLFCDKDETRQSIDDGNICVINALRASLHDGSEEVNYGRPGRIAGSANIPAVSLLDPETKAYRPWPELEAMFKDVGALDKDRVVLYCGGGIAATSDAFVLTMLGKDNVTVYDASMSEWANDPDMPMETG